MYLCHINLKQLLMCTKVMQEQIIDYFNIQPVVKAKSTLTKCLTLRECRRKGVIVGIKIAKEKATLFVN